MQQSEEKGKTNNLIIRSLKSFRYAFDGVKTLWREEHNFRIHIFAAVLVLILGFIFHISILEWISIILASGFVIGAEILNTSIENLADFVSPEKHHEIKKIKDLAAAAVLISAIVALIIGTLIFLPYILNTFF